MGADSYTCQRRGLLVRPVRRRDPAGMDIHVEQRFKHHHALRGERLPMPAQAWQVVVYMGGGPSLMYAANAMAAYEEFAAATA